MSDRLATLDVAVLPSQIASTWLQESRVSSHMSRFPRHAQRRSSWMGMHERVLVVLRDDDGGTGVGATRCGEASAAVLERHFPKLLRGRSAAEHEELYAELTGAIETYGPSGVAAAALSAVDLALWDLRARRAGVPLHRLLADDARATLPCYATVSAARVDTATGFAGVKLAAPWGPVDGVESATETARTIRAVRASAPAGQLVMVDAACSWTPEYTDLVLDHLEPGDLDWLEDPISPHDRAGYARLAERLPSSGTRLCLGNYAFSAREAEQVVTDGFADVLQPDLTWAGGLTPAVPLAARAAAAGLGFSPHYAAMQPWAVHLVATLDHTDPAEYMTLPSGPTRPDYPELPMPVAGGVPVPATPGAAAEPAAELVAQATWRRVSLG